MGVKTFFNNLKTLSRSEVSDLDLLNQPGMINGMAGMDFMAYTGSHCEESFCVSLKDFKSINNAYQRCSTLKTVVNRNAMAMANGKMWIVDENDNDVSDKYPSIKKLFDQPNPLQTWSEFEMQLDVYRQVFGEVFIYAVIPSGFSIRDSVALWVINPSLVEIRLTNKLYKQSDIDGIVIDYYLNTGSESISLERDRLLYIKDVNQNLDFSSNNIRGESRLYGLGNSIRNIIQAEEALYSLNRDRGALGMLSPKERNLMPPTPGEKESALSHYRDAYGILKHQSKLVMPTIPMDYVKLGFNVQELMLLEGMDKNIQIVASVMGYPYELLGLTSGASLSSNSGRFEGELKKMMYQDNIIPIARIYSEKYTKFFQLDEGDKIVKDFDNVESLRTAEAELAGTIYKKTSALHGQFVDGAISLEEYRLNLGYDEKIYGTTINTDGENQ